MAESSETPEIEDDVEQFGFRDGNVFMIDVSPEMFENDPNLDETYFDQCLKTYGRILSQKLMWNRRDWMGLMFFNCTKNWDPDTEHVSIVQEFSEIHSGMLKDVIKIVAAEDKKKTYLDPENYKDLDKCLHDALWQASRMFDSIKISMSKRRVVLLTARDDPLSEDVEERHKIRLRAKTYADINVELRIIGLGEKWDPMLFYNDVHMLTNVASVGLVERPKIMDLEHEMRFPARSSGRLKWRIVKGVEIPTFIVPFSCKTKYLKKVWLHSDTNEVLDVYKHWREPQLFGDDSDDEKDPGIVQTRIPDHVQKGVEYGGKWITFTPKEAKEIRLISEKGINLIGFKPIAKDLMYHIKPVKFVGVENTATEGEKQLFAALLNKCRSKKVMAVCSVTHRAAPYLAKLIPHDKMDGFYLYKTAFKEQVHNLSTHTKPYVYDDTEKPMPVDKEGVELLEKVVKRLRRNWNPQKFTNPKLDRQFAYIEALELDVDFTPPPDSTLADRNLINKRLKDLPKKFQDMFGPLSIQNPKRPASSTAASRNDSVKVIKFDDKVIRRFVDENTLEKQTVKTLKAITQSIGVQSTGKKMELVERITKHYKK